MATLRSQAMFTHAFKHISYAQGKGIFYLESVPVLDPDFAANPDMQLDRDLEPDLETDFDQVPEPEFNVEPEPELDPDKDMLPEPEPAHLLVFFPLSTYNPE